MVLIQSEQCFGNADIVVEVALGVEYVIFFRKDGGNQFFRCGLAIGSRDANHGNVELSAMLASQVLEGLQAVVHSYNPRKEEGGRRKEITLGDVFVNDGVGTSFLQSLDGKSISVERLPSECEEDASFRTVAAVGSDTGMLLVELV